MKWKTLMLSLAATLAASSTAQAGSTLEAAEICNASIDEAIAAFDPQPTYRLKSAIGSRKRTMNYKLYLDDAQYAFKCVVKGGEVLELRWPDRFNAVLAEQTQRSAEGEVASIVN